MTFTDLLLRRQELERADTALEIAIGAFFAVLVLQAMGGAIGMDILLGGQF